MKPLEELHARADRKKRRAELARMAGEILFVLIGIPLFGAIIGVLVWCWLGK